jgi:hypothetical protein
MTDNVISTENMLQKISFHGEAPPLLPGRIDIYVLGRVGSGKSMFLGGLLYFAYNQGRLALDGTHNMQGRAYAMDLMDCIKSGRLIEGTPDDVIAYILSDFIDNKKHKHPITLFEMSGEIFKRIYDAGADFNSDPSIPDLFKKYVSGNNRKVLFFTIDIHSDYMKQFDMIDKTLKVFEKEKLLDKTKAICLIITKWDEYEKKEDEKAGQKFIEENFRNLDQTFVDFSNQYGIHYEIFKFSIGSFDVNKQYQYAPDDSKTLFDWLCSFIPFVNENNVAKRLLRRIKNYIRMN